MDENEKKELMENPDKEHLEEAEKEREGETPEEHEEAYSFVKETIKEKPLDRRTVLRRAGWIAGAAVLFGVIAALVFSITISGIDKYREDKESAPKVNIPQDEEPSGEEDEETPSEEESQAPVQ